MNVPAYAVDNTAVATFRVEDAPGWAKPVPETDPVSEIYFTACAGGVLLIQRCPKCGHRQHYPRMMCTACAATPDWEPSAGTGTVYTYTVVQRPAQPGFDPKTPYVLAMVELDEGPRLLGNITGIAPDKVGVGLRVQAYGVRVAEGIAVPFWEPCAS